MFIQLMLTSLLATTPTVRALRAHSAPAPARRAASWHPAVPFIEDDFGRALALAKARKLPVFIDGWAPW